jgi:hypothetical protein
VEVKMRKLVIPLAILTLTPCQELGAQTTDEVAVGERVRISAPGCNLPKKDGRFGGIEGDSVHLRMAGQDLSCAMSVVHRLEVYQGRHRWNRKAAKGAMIGGALGAVAGGLLGDKDYYPVFDPRTAAIGLGAGAIIGAGIGKGPRSRKSLLVGTGIAAAGGLLVASSCEGMGCLVVLLVVPPPIVVGGVIGLIRGEDRWEEVSLPRVQPFVKALPHGRVELGVSLPLRR